MCLWCFGICVLWFVLGLFVLLFLFCVGAVLCLFCVCDCDCCCYLCLCVLEFVVFCEFVVCVGFGVL